jgi:hypothetical protein
MCLVSVAKGCENFNLVENCTMLSYVAYSKYEYHRVWWIYIGKWELEHTMRKYINNFLYLSLRFTECQICQQCKDAYLTKRVWLIIILLFIFMWCLLQLTRVAAENDGRTYKAQISAKVSAIW